MKFILFSTLLSSLYLLHIIIRIEAQLNPSFRKLHSAVLVGKKLYIFGGFIGPSLTPENETLLNKNPDDRFFYLDVSDQFDTSNLPWRTIPNNVNELPLASFSSIVSGGLAASIGGINNDTLFFINNEIDTATQSVPPVHSFNTQNNSWITQNISGERPIGRNQMRVVTDSKGKIYLLTGFNFNDTQGVTHSNGLFILDTISFTCAIKEAPLSRIEYSATLLPNGMILYLAGWESNSNYIVQSNNFYTIFLYDINTGIWNTRVTNGSIPSGNAGMSSVLGLKGDRLITFGGLYDSNNFLSVLDLSNFEWFNPKVNGRGPIYERGEHTANVIGKYMVITFGSNGFNEAKYKSSGESDVLLLDISDDSEYIWTTHFDPTPLITTTSPPSLPPSLPSQSSQNNNNNNNNTNNIIIGCVIGFVLTLSVGTVFFFIIRRRNRSEQLTTFN